VNYKTYRHIYQTSKWVSILVNQAARYGNVTPQGANAFLIEYNAGKTIGTGIRGEAASGIRVSIRNGQVQTAFPIALP